MLPLLSEYITRQLYYKLYILHAKTLIFNSILS